MRNTKLTTSFYSILIIVLAATLSVYTFSPVRALTNTPTYVLGVSNPTDPLILDLQGLTSSVTILPSISSLGTLGGNSILFVDGAWLRSVSSLDPTILSTLVGAVVSGLPTVVVRGPPALLGDSISGLTRFKAPGLPLIAEGDKIFGTLADGTRVGSTLEVLSGFDYAVGTLFTWAQQILQSGTTPLASPLIFSATPSATTDPSPFWLFQLKAGIDTGDAFAPFGRVSGGLTEYALQNSGSSSFRWKNFFLNTTVQPGIQIYQSSQSNWRTMSEITQFQPGSNAGNVIVAHGPTSQSTSGPFSVSYGIGVVNGVNGAMTTASQNQTYALKNTSVTDLSVDPNVGWDHEISTRSSSGTLTFSIIPGWTLRVDASASVNLSGTADTTFATLQGNSVTGTATDSIFFSVSGG
jgi:hypothetical protein